MGHFVPLALNPQTPRARKAGSNPEEKARERVARN